MKRIISEVGAQQVTRLLDLITSIGRRNSLRDPMAALVEKAGMTGAQMHAVMWIGRDERLTMGALAQRIGVTEKTITGIVDRLERGKYVQRERSASDRRVVQVVLTRQGQKFHAQVHAEIERRLGLFLNFLDEQDRAALFRILENIAAKLDVAHTSDVEPTSHD